MRQIRTTFSRRVQHAGAQVPELSPLGFLLLRSPPGTTMALHISGMSSDSNIKSDRQLATPNPSVEVCYIVGQSQYTYAVKNGTVQVPH